MIKKSTLLILLITMLVSTTSFSQAHKTAVDYVGIPGPILFEKQSFNLSWSAHPSGNFYKQEYIAKGVDAGKYKTMVLIDVMTGEADIKTVVGAKLAELKQLKAANPIVNYDSFQKNGEYMIDFLLSANGPDGKTMSIVERNVYRYKIFTDKSGQKGVLLFGISTRGYGTGINPFLIALKANKGTLVNAVAQYKLPEVMITVK
ncbi:MAG: hypothetical protein ABIQ31_03705 [Ferruginibacter sp.]